MSRKEYFAYGSNLNFEQMAYRCPEATVVGTAKLDVGFQLTGVKSVLLAVAGVGKLEKPEFNRALGEGGVEVQGIMLSST